MQTPEHKALMEAHERARIRAEKADAAAEGEYRRAAHRHKRVMHQWRRLCKLMVKHLGRVKESKRELGAAEGRRDRERQRNNHNYQRAVSRAIAKYTGR